MATIHGWFLMIYGILQAEFMETKHNGHIHRYGASLVTLLFMYLNRLTMTYGVRHSGRSGVSTSGNYSTACDT